MNREITKLELLLAIAMSEYYETTHVHYIPAGCNYTKLLKVLRGQKLIEPMTSKFYKLTQKGKDYLIRNGDPVFTEVDAKIDEFIDGLK